jgi:hypothetical protein
MTQDSEAPAPSRQTNSTTDRLAKTPRAVLVPYCNKFIVKTLLFEPILMILGMH